MKKLLFINFLTDTFKFFVLVCLSVSLIVWVIQAVSFLDFATEDGHSLYVYFLYTLHNFPKIFHRVLPFIFFISLFYQINQYELRNELLIFWTIGVNKLYFVKVVILFSIFFLIFQIIIGGFIAPKTQNDARSYIRNSNIDFFPTLLQRGKFIDAVKNLTIFIMSEDESGNYKNIFIKELYNANASQDQEESKMIHAKKGSLKIQNNKRYLELVDGSIINKKGKKINTFSFQKIDFDLMELATRSTKYPKIQELNSLLLIKCLNYYSKGIEKQLKSKLLRCNSQSVKDIREEICKRFLKPLYLPLLALIACLIIFTSKESLRYNFYKIVVFLSAVLVIVISEVSLRYSSFNIFGMYFFIFTPLLLFLVTYIFLIMKFKTIYK